MAALCLAAALPSCLDTDMKVRQTQHVFWSPIPTWYISQHIFNVSVVCRNILSWRLGWCLNCVLIVLKMSDNNLALLSLLLINLRSYSVPYVKAAYHPTSSYLYLYLSCLSHYLHERKTSIKDDAVQTDLASSHGMIWAQLMNTTFEDHAAYCSLEKWHMEH